jgi:hypothetical protein
MVDACHGWEVMHDLRRAQEAVTVYMSAMHDHLERTVDIGDERRRAAQAVYTLVRLGLRKGWADFTHVALFCAAFANPRNGVGLLCHGDKVVEVIDGWSKAILLRVTGPGPVSVQSGDRDYEWKFDGDGRALCTFLLGRVTTYSPRDVHARGGYLMHIVWVEGNPLQLLLDALRTNLGVVEEVARVLPVQLVPELVASFHMCSGIDAIKSRFMARERKRLADTPLGKAFAKRAPSNVQATTTDSGRGLDPRDGHGS